MQNGVAGLGAICGASIGGIIADNIGWRWCFLLQAPLSIFALVVGALAVQDQRADMLLPLEQGLRAVWKRVDFTGAVILVAAISLQLLGLSLGGNELPWDDPRVWGSFAGSLVLFAAFVLVESKTEAIPMIPLRLIKGRVPVATQIANICAGLAAYGVGVLFTWATVRFANQLDSSSSWSRSSSKSSCSNLPPKQAHASSYRRLLCL